MQDEDRIFPRKEHVRIGSQFTYFGRTKPRSKWTVVKITTYSLERVGRKRQFKYIAHSVKQVHKLKDTVELQSKDGQTRVAAFHYLSYSAIWRLD